MSLSNIPNSDKYGKSRNSGAGGSVSKPSAAPVRRAAAPAFRTDDGRMNLRNTQSTRNNRAAEELSGPALYAVYAVAAVLGLLFLKWLF